MTFLLSFFLFLFVHAYSLFFFSFYFHFEHTNKYYWVFIPFFWPFVSLRFHTNVFKWNANEMCLCIGIQPEHRFNRLIKYFGHIRQYKTMTMTIVHAIQCDNSSRFNYDMYDTRLIWFMCELPTAALTISSAKEPKKRKYRSLIAVTHVW